MQILNTFVAKQGPGGKRNRAARRRALRRGHVAEVQKQESSLLDDLCNEDFGLSGNRPGILDVEAIAKQSQSKPLDLTGIWDEDIARKALTLFEQSGKSQRAFAAEHGISDSKLRTWKKKLETKVA